MDPADQYYPSPQRSLDYSNPSLDDQPSDEFSLPIQSSDEDSTNLAVSINSSVFILCYVILLHQ